MLTQVTLERTAKDFKKWEEIFDRAASADPIEWVKLECEWNVTYARDIPPDVFVCLKLY